jgi:hypothetical protein
VTVLVNLIASPSVVAAVVVAWTAGVTGGRGVSA